MRRRPEVRACEIAQKNHTSTRCGTRRFASPKPRRRRTTLSTHQVFTLTLQRCIRVFTNPLYDLSFSRMLSADTLPTLFFRVFSACLERASFDEEPRGAAEENASGKGLRLAFHSAFLRQACGLVETPSARWPEGTGLFSSVSLHPPRAQVHGRRTIRHDAFRCAASGKSPTSESLGLRASAP